MATKRKATGTRRTRAKATKATGLEALESHVVVDEDGNPIQIYWLTKKSPKELREKFLIDPKAAGNRVVRQSQVNALSSMIQGMFKHRKAKWIESGKKTPYDPFTTERSFSAFIPEIPIRVQLYEVDGKEYFLVRDGQHRLLGFFRDRGLPVAFTIVSRWSSAVSEENRELSRWTPEDHLGVCLHDEDDPGYESAYELFTWLDRNEYGVPSRFQGGEEMGFSVGWLSAILAGGSGVSKDSGPGNRLIKERRFRVLFDDEYDGISRLERLIEFRNQFYQKRVALTQKPTKAMWSILANLMLVHEALPEFKVNRLIRHLKKHDFVIFEGGILRAREVLDRIYNSQGKQYPLAYHMATLAHEHNAQFCRRISEMEREEDGCGITLNVVKSGE